MTHLQLTPIGTSPAWYNHGEANSGFLLEVDGFRILVDCGSGVIARYLDLFGTDRPIDAIVLSHVHADHCFDLVPLKFGIGIGPLADWRPQLWLPPGAPERLARLVSAWDADFSFFTDTFDVHEFAPGTDFALGGCSVSSLEVPHYVESFALRFDHAAGSFGYTADLGPTPHVAPFMAGVDVLLAEAALAEHADLSAPDRGHITATEAGHVAEAAGVGRLLLTHVPEELGFERAVAAAATQFAGPVDLARSGELVPVAQVIRSAS
ncbi:MAG: beta-lactamase domain protein [Thermoleophilia bacterium]|nr:beta-lactamase domain protein [Thermoleophilia bacterium]